LRNKGTDLFETCASLSRDRRQNGKIQKSRGGWSDPLSRHGFILRKPSRRKDSKRIGKGDRVERFK